MSSFELWVYDRVVRVRQRGVPDFEETNRSLAGAAELAKASAIHHVLFDLRDADVANYYSYAARHAELAPSLGFDTGFTIAILGRPEAEEVLGFYEKVARSHGWQARAFTDEAAAERWISPGIDGVR